MSENFIDEIAKMAKDADFKIRFKAEYKMLKNRADKLEAMLEKYQAGTLDFTPNCSYNLLHEQLVYMRQYQRTLEERAKIESVDL